MARQLPNVLRQLRTRTERQRLQRRWSSLPMELVLDASRGESVLEISGAFRT